MDNSVTECIHMLDSDHCQLNWFILYLLQTTDRNDHSTKPIRWHIISYHNSAQVYEPRLEPVSNGYKCALSQWIDSKSWVLTIWAFYGSRYSASCEFESRVRVASSIASSSCELRVEMCELQVSHICELNDFGFQCNLSACVCFRWALNDQFCICIHRDYVFEMWSFID